MGPTDEPLPTTPATAPVYPDGEVALSGRGARGLLPLNALAMVLQWSALICWAYVAVVGVLAPQYLRSDFEGVIPVRTDLVGIAAFATSFLLLVLTGFVRPYPEPLGWPKRSILAATRSLAVHGWAGWAYISANSISHRATLQMRLTHLANWPTEGEFAAAGLLAAVVSTGIYFALASQMPRSSGRLGQ